MDNLKARIDSVAFQIDELRAALAAANIKVSIRYGTNLGVEEIRFSCLVGEHNERWLIRLYPDKGSLTFSGGVTKTFFGHNLWVFDNEFQQLQAIIGIVVKRLSTIDGLSLPKSLLAGSYESVSVERVELTNHFALPEDIDQAAAIERIDTMFKVLFPDRRDRDGDTHEKPGTTSIGKSKSTKVCRAYDPSTKFAHKPEHVPAESWAALTAVCGRHLRVELIMDKREIGQSGFTTVGGWHDKDKILAYLQKKSERYGLNVRYQASKEILKPSDVRATSERIFEYAQYWFTDGERGKKPSTRSGTYTRFKQYMASKGFNINIPFVRHVLLAHGLHEVLRPEARAELPNSIRQDVNLFRQWWRRSN